MGKKKETTYSEAITRLEEIVNRIENNELEIDALGENIKEANKLIEFCSKKLSKTEADVEKLLKDGSQSE